MKKKRRQYVPRVRPAISTSSKTFVDKKTKSKSRKKLKEIVSKNIEDELN